MQSKPLLLLILSLFFFSLVYAAEDLTFAPAEDVAEGGRLYDKWWAEYDLRKPENTHPLYPATGKKTGADTWRCKECHGWDYRGFKGAYGSGGHFTGITGIRQYEGRKVETIIAILKDPRHGFDQVMYDPALYRIALFVSEGQFDMSKVINDKTKKSSGQASRGKQSFADHCMTCHGDDGRRINFKSRQTPEYLGTIANKNPWEAMHKIRNGHPGAVMGHRGMGGEMHNGMMRSRAMPSMLSLLNLEQQADLLAYLQKLPTQ